MKNIITLVKECEFAAAHRITFHEGKCKFLHGHNFLVTISITVETKKGIDMVLDFGRIKEIVMELDHKTLIYGKDELLLQVFGSSANANFVADVVILDFEVTAENLAQYLKEKITAEVLYFLGSVVDEYTVGVLLQESANNTVEV